MLPVHGTASDVTSESEIGGTDSAALRTSWTCLRLCGSCVTSFFRGSDPASYEAPETSIADSSPYSLSLSLAGASKSLGLMLHLRRFEIWRLSVA